MFKIIDFMFVTFNKLYEKVTLFRNTTRGAGFIGFTFYLNIIALLKYFKVKIPTLGLMLILFIFLLPFHVLYSNEERKIRLYKWYESLQFQRKLVGITVVLSYFILSFFIFIYSMKNWK